MAVPPHPTFVSVRNSSLDPMGGDRLNHSGCPARFESSGWVGVYFRLPVLFIALPVDPADKVDILQTVVELLPKLGDSLLQAFRPVFHALQFQSLGFQTSEEGARPVGVGGWLARRPWRYMMNGLAPESGPRSCGYPSRRGGSRLGSTHTAAQCLQPNQLQPHYGEL